MLAKTTSMSYGKYRIATLNAAKNLTPGNCTNFNKVKAAWDAVSVPAQTGDPTCSTTGGVTVTNVAVNGGFESGSGSWGAMAGTNYVAYPSGQIPGESARSGQYYAAMNTSQSGGGIYQDVPVSTVAGNLSCASAWVQTQGTTGASGTFTLFLMGGSSTESAGVNFLADSTGWQQVQTCVSATTSHTQLRIQFYPTPNTPTLEIDDIDVHASMAINGGFESGSGSWGAMAGTNYVAYPSGQIPGESARSGQYYAAMNTSQSGGGIYQDVPVSTVAGNLSCASAWVQTQGTTGASGTFTLFLMGGSSTESAGVNFLADSTGWQQVQTCVSATTSHTQLRIQFYPTPNTPTLEIDDIDVHASMAINGGFESGSGWWGAMAGTNYVAYPSGQIPGESARSGQYYAAMNTSQSGGGIYQDVPVSTVAGNLSCASAWVQTQGTTGASGTFTLFLMGGSSTESAGVNFLADSTGWQQVQTCVSATTSHTQLRIQFYPTPNTPTLEIDDIDVH